MSLLGSGLVEAGTYKPTEWGAVNAGLSTATLLFSHPVEHRQNMVLRTLACAGGSLVLTRVR